MEVDQDMIEYIIPRKYHRIIRMILTHAVFFVFLWNPTLHGQTYRFERPSVENCLSQNTVWCSMQDSKGFLWFGTKDGLNRFDGYNFLVFRNSEGDPNSIGNNFVHSLFEDTVTESIWVGTDKGLYIYSQETESFSPFSIEDTEQAIKSQVNSIVKDQNGDFWIGAFSEGVYRYNPLSHELKLYHI